MSEADLVDQGQNVGVAGEEVVVPAFEPSPTDVEGRGLAAQERGLLVDFHPVAMLAELVGSGQAGRPGADHTYSHSVASPSMGGVTAWLSPPPSPPTSSCPALDSLRSDTWCIHRKTCPRTIIGSSSVACTTAT